MNLFYCSSLSHSLSQGFTPLDLKNAQKIFEKMGGKAELIDLREKSGKKEIREKAEEACVLVLRRGVDVLLGGRRGEGEGKGEGEGEGEKGKEKEEEEEKEKKKGKGKTADDFFEEQVKLDADKKAYMYGRIVNKVARYNLCFAQESQEPDYINKKGRIVGYNEVPILSSLRDSFSFLLGEKGEGLVAEGNYYYDPKKCGIGFHGDGERKKVVAVRLGSSLPLHYQWFIEGGVVGERIKLLLNHGDIYIMSEKATGNDWKKKKIFTLRHAAGCEKFLKIKGSLG